MAELAGFLAVFYIGRDAIKRALDTVWRLRWKDARGKLSFSKSMLNRHVSVTGAFSFSQPSFLFLGSQNKVRLHLPYFARLDLQIDGASSGGAFIEVAPYIDVPIVGWQEYAFEKAMVDLSGFTIEVGDIQLTWYDTPMDGESSDIVLSVEFRQLLTEELRQRAKPFLTFPLPTDKLFLTQLALITSSGVAYNVPNFKLGGIRILDEWLAVCINDDKYDTSGNILDVEPPPAPPLQPGSISPLQFNSALIINSALLQNYLVYNATTALTLALGARKDIHPIGAPLVAIDNDAIQIRTSGTIDAPDPLPGTIPFSATMSIGLRVSGDWFYASVSPNIDIDVPWFVDVLTSIADFFGADVFAKLRRANRGSLATLFRSNFAINVPEFEDLHVGMRALGVVLRPRLTGIYGTASVYLHDPKQSAYKKHPSPPTELRIDQALSVHIRDRFFQLGFSHEQEPLLSIDPTYRLTYQVRRSSDGRPIIEGTTWSGAPTFGPPIDLWDPFTYLEKNLEFIVVLERPPGNELVRSRPNSKTEIIDLFDRSHPYARWRHTVAWHDSKTQPPKTHYYVRLSAIHKTKISERCKFADTGARRPERYELQSLDKLPAPLNANFSSRLCPYCFGSN